MGSVRSKRQSTPGHGRMRSLTYFFSGTTLFVDPMLPENDSLWAQDAVAEGEIERAEDWTPPWGDRRYAECDGVYDCEVIHPQIIKDAEYLSLRYAARVLRALKKEYAGVTIEVTEEAECDGGEQELLGQLLIEPEEEWDGELEDWPGLAPVLAFVAAREEAWLNEALEDLNRRSKRKRLYQ